MFKEILRKILGIKSPSLEIGRFLKIDPVVLRAAAESQEEENE